MLLVPGRQCCDTGKGIGQVREGREGFCVTMASDWRSEGRSDMGAGSGKHISWCTLTGALCLEEAQHIER